MTDLDLVLKNILLVSQFLAAGIGVIYFKKHKNSYWKWFSIYLIIIFFQELFWTFGADIKKQYQFWYFILIGLPLEYLFFFWLYALKSLKKKIIFNVFTVIYAFSILISSLYLDLDEVISISSNVGTFFLIILIILEFIKQIKSDDILEFRENKMFFINLGLVLFYIGSYPYHVFGPELYENHKSIWDMYRGYFLISNISMYLLFTASFIWGKAR